MPANTFLYFSYGSNMLSSRLRERCPSARPIGMAELPDHELRWHKRSKDNSGNATLSPAQASTSLAFFTELKILIRLRSTVQRVSDKDMKRSRLMFCIMAITFLPRPTKLRR